MTKKELDAIREEASLELYTMILGMHYMVMDLEMFRDDLKETMKYATKDFNKAKNKLKKSIKKYEELSGTTYKPKGLELY